MGPIHLTEDQVVTLMKVASAGAILVAVFVGAFLFFF